MSAIEFLRNHIRSIQTVPFNNIKNSDISVKILPHRLYEEWEINDIKTLFEKTYTAGKWANWGKDIHGFDEKELDKSFELFKRVLDFDANHQIKGASEDIQIALKMLDEKDLNREGYKTVFSLLKNLEQYSKIIVEILFGEAEVGKILDKYEMYNFCLKKLGFKFVESCYRVSVFRNSYSHTAEDYNNVELIQIIVKMLIEYISITNFKYDELTDKMNSLELKKSFDFKPYLRKIVDKYDDTTRSGYKYFDEIKWKEKIEAINSIEKEESDESRTCIEDDIASLISRIKEGRVKYIKIFGEAGQGKTKALEEISYRLSKEYLEEKSDLIPIYIELKALNKDNKIAQIRSIIDDVFDSIDDPDSRQKLRNKYLDEGKLLLLLDGYNEIMDNESINNATKEINNELPKHNKTKIILTTRRDTMTILKNATVLELKPLTIDQKKKYLEYCVKRNKDIEHVNDKVLGIIRKKIDEDNDYFIEINSPFKLEVFAKAVMVSKCIPDNYMDIYLDDLIEREKEKEQDMEMQNVDMLLQAMSMDIKIRKKENLNISDITDDIDRFKIGISDVKKVLGLVTGMGILIESSPQKDVFYYAFRCSEFQTYFWGKAFLNGMNKKYDNKQ